MNQYDMLQSQSQTQDQPSNPNVGSDCGTAISADQQACPPKDADSNGESDSPYNSNSPYNSDSQYDGLPAMPASRTRSPLDRYGRRSTTSDLDSLSNSNDYETAPTRRSMAPAQQVKEKATEFEMFVQNSVGQALPIYGSWLFNRVPSTYAPVDHIPVTSEYTLGPGDEVDVRVWGQINFSQRLVVDRTGGIFIPQVGRVSLAGLKYAQLADVTKSAIGRVYKNFDLNVNMGQLRSIQILVVGYARRPGTYTVSSLSTFANAIFSSGGPSARGSMRNIQLKRNGKTIKSLDLYDLLLHGDQSDDCPLQPGDVIFVPAAGPRVAIAGSIENPAIYEIKPETSLRQALNDAGGLSAVAAGQRAVLERVDGGSALRSEEVDMSGSGPETLLRNGDIVRLLPVIPRFNKTVTLRGNVADPTRMPWHEGMKISDLIPDKESLLTRNYWRERNRLTDPRMELIADTDVKESQIKANRQGRTKNYDDEVQDTSSDRTLGAAQSSSQKLVIRHFEAKNTVQPPAPAIDWGYAVIERLDKQSLDSRLIPFNLGKVVLQHDASADLPLEPGDIVTILSDADVAAPRAQQTKFVRIEGEVNMAGVYSVHPGETLRQLVLRAGGLTPNAYLYGAQFTRESTKKEQQKSYSEFLDQLERDMNQNGALLGGKVLSAQQAAVAETSLASQKTMIEKLRQTPATGRIVLDLKPDSTTVDSIPDLELENGDRLYVPSVPSTVSVVGTVYNQSAFLYGSDRNLGAYLQEAGGPTRYADKRHIFVIRPDGSVIARDTRSGMFSGNFNDLRIYPGDTVVVPTNLTKTTMLRGMMDWSQVISNFGIGAAAVNVLK